MVAGVQVEAAGWSGGAQHVHETSGAPVSSRPTKRLCASPKSHVHLGSRAEILIVLLDQQNKQVPADAG